MLHGGWGVFRRGRWETKVEERLEIVDHAQFLRLRSHTLRDYKFMMTISLDTGQCVDQNWCSRYSVSVSMKGAVMLHHGSCIIGLSGGRGARFMFRSTEEWLTFLQTPGSSSHFIFYSFKEKRCHITVFRQTCFEIMV